MSIQRYTVDDSIPSCLPLDGGKWVYYSAHLAEVARAVAEEREVCARMFEGRETPEWCRYTDHMQDFCGCAKSAAAIRSRATTPAVVGAPLTISAETLRLVREALAHTCDPSGCYWSEAHGAQAALDRETGGAKG